MARTFGPHRVGDVANDTLADACARLAAEAADVIDHRALAAMVDDTVAAEVMQNERVDTLMLAGLTFDVESDAFAAPPRSLGTRGVLAFTEGRMIAAHGHGIFRFERFIEVFKLDGSANVRATEPDIGRRRVYMIEVANARGWHRVVLGGPDRVDQRVLDRWSTHATERLSRSLRPHWTDTRLTGWHFS